MLPWLVDPVVRQARRFSVVSGGVDAGGRGESALSHANADRAPIATSPTPPRRAHTEVARDAAAGPASLSPGGMPDAMPARHGLDAPDPSRPTEPIDIPTDLRGLRDSGHAEDGEDAGAMAASLPADDGMRHLRARIHQIRHLPLGDDEKARLMHSVMTERYNFLRPQSPSSFVSHERPFTPASGQSVFSDIHHSSPISAATEVDPSNPYNLRPGDTGPTYRVRQESAENAAEDDDFETADDGSALGCEHYKRNVKVQCHACRRWYTCRHCHDAVEDHNLNRKKTQNMLCMVCGTPQAAAGHCANCGIQAAWHYCDICKLWDDDSNKKIYHCDDCGICRKGEGLGKDFIHCKRCNVCIAISYAETHKCLERATDCDCPICGEYLFNSSSAVVSLPCGHYLHKGCYTLYMETAYKCPMCKKSAVNMELQWQKLSEAIEAQPMPEQFEDTRAVIKCNDCAAKSSVKYHWLGNKCATCDSYNTTELRIMSGPESQQMADAYLTAEAESAPRSAASAGSPSSVPLPSPRYYFQPDQPEGTWLPGQLPSFPFQIPHFPGMPQMPNLPGMPQMPDPYELMERVSRSFSPFRNYLNPTGEVADEHVPIIDLGDEPRECKATDGSTVLQPSLPQYVLERFSRSFTPIRNYLNPPFEEHIPRLDLSGGRNTDGLDFWGENDGVHSFPPGSDDDGDEQDSSEDSLEDDDEDDEDEDVDEAGDRDLFEKDFKLPWKP